MQLFKSKFSNSSASDHACSCVQLNLSEDLFVSSGVVEHFGLKLSRLRSFLLAVSHNYSDVPPYHNFNHVVYVLHATWLVCARASVLLCIHVCPCFCESCPAITAIPYHNFNHVVCALHATWLVCACKCGCVFMRAFVSVRAVLQLAVP